MQRKPYNFSFSLWHKQMEKPHNTKCKHWKSTVRIDFRAFTLTLYTRWHLHNQDIHAIQPETTCTPIHTLTHIHEQSQSKYRNELDETQMPSVLYSVPYSAARVSSSWESNHHHHQHERTDIHMHTHTHECDTQTADTYIVWWTSFHSIGGGNNNRNSSIILCTTPCFILPQQNSKYWHTRHIFDTTNIPKMHWIGF